MSWPTLVTSKTSTSSRDLRRADKQEQAFLTVSSAVLASSFPNPNRTGCPDSSVLQRIAANKMRLNEAAPWMKHLGSCSECFRDFSNYKEARRHRKTLRLAYAVAALVIVSAILTVWLRTYPLFPGYPAQATLDLRNVSPTRGPNSQQLNEAPPLLRSTKEVLIYLPPGAEGSYEVRVIDDYGNLVGAASGTCVTKESSSLLTVRLDLSRHGIGFYSFVLQRDAGPMRSYKVRLK